MTDRDETPGSETPEADETPQPTQLPALTDVDKPLGPGPKEPEDQEFEPQTADPDGTPADNPEEAEEEEFEPQTAEPAEGTVSEPYQGTPVLLDGEEATAVKNDAPDAPEPYQGVPVLLTPEQAAEIKAQPAAPVVIARTPQTRSAVPKTENRETVPAKDEETPLTAPGRGRKRR